MINVNLFYNSQGEVFGFSVENHGETHVCAAISVLTLNTVNSIEALTGLTNNDFTCEHQTDGGYLAFSLNISEPRHERAGLLLDAFALGVSSVAEVHPSEVCIQT